MLELVGESGPCDEPRCRRGTVVVLYSATTLVPNVFFVKSMSSLLGATKEWIGEGWNFYTQGFVLCEQILLGQNANRPVGVNLERLRDLGAFLGDGGNLHLVHGAGVAVVKNSQRLDQQLACLLFC